MSERTQFELNVYPKISRKLGIATRTERFATREDAEARKGEIEALDTERRLEIEITEVRAVTTD